jgi:hypothetical protein
MDVSRGALPMSLRFVSLLRLTLLCFCGIFFLSISFSSIAFAQSESNPITVISETDTIHFPDSIDFRLSAVDANSPITEAIIYITYNTYSGAYPTQHIVTINKPQDLITVDWQESTTDSNFQTPGTPVQYYWVLQDSTGNSYTQAIQYFTTIDSRFPWQHLSSGKLQVNWYERSQAFGQLLLSKAENALHHISANLGSGLLHPINLWVYASDSDFHGALSPNSYEWVGGEAIPTLNEAFISVTSSGDTTLLRDMPHELTHLVFHQMTANGQQVPTWFDEGLAVYNQFYHEPEMKATFEEALMNHSLLPLSSISLGFPADANQAYLAYAQSWQLVSYMYSTFGKLKMQKFIKNMNNPELDFNSDMQITLGEDEPHLENQWHLSLNQPATLSPDQVTPTVNTPLATSTTSRGLTNGSIPLLTTVGVLLILLPLLGIIIIVVYQRRRRTAPAPVQSGYYGQSMNGPVFPPALQGRRQGYPANPAVQQRDPQSIQYMPFYHSSASSGQAPGAAPPAQPAPQFSPVLGASRDFDYPAMPQEHIDQNGNDLAPSSPVAPTELFGGFQENISQPPPKQAPQE